MVTLRDMKESDIERYVKWFTDQSESNDWNHWDAPWEPIDTSEEAERASWTEYYQSVKDLPAETIRWKFEIEADGEHIGWICSYGDLDYLENKENIIAIGIDIPERRHRRGGNGTAAFSLFMEYLKKAGHKSFYTQTWSGNYPMIKLAEKLGFKEFARVKGLRELNGEKYDAITFRLDL